MVSRHEELLGTLTQSLTCQICLELMYKPYALAPCGHSACYDCLVSWFRTPQGSEPTAVQVPAYTRKKTCPHCRAVVRDRPTEVWNIKDMVDALVKSKFVEPHPNPPIPASRTSDVDPWTGIFRGPSTMLDMFPNVLFGHRVHQPHHDHEQAHPAAPEPAVARQMMGMRDEEDGGIYRCIDCYHEIWDGVCSSCGRVYPGHDPSEDEDAGLTHMLWDDPDASDFDDEDDDQMRLETWGQHRFGPAPTWFSLGRLFDNNPDMYPRLPGEDDEDDEDYVDEVPRRHFLEIDEDEEGDGDDDDDESYEGSFIDDSEAPPHVLRRSSHSAEHEDQDDVEILARHYRDTAGRHVHSSPSGRSPALSDEEDDVRPVTGPIRTRPGLLRRGRGTVISDDEGDAESIQ